MDYQRTRVALPEEEISTGIEKILIDYSIESILGQLSQFDAGSASFTPLVEPLTDFHVAHRREIINEEYDQFLDAIQTSSYHHKNLVGERSERQNNSHPQLVQQSQMNQPSSSRDLVVSRPELDPIAHLKQQPNSIINSYLLLQNGIQLVQDTTQITNGSLGAKKELTSIAEINGSSLHIGDLPLNNMRRSQMTLATSLDKLERYHTPVNSSLDAPAISPEWLSEAVNFVRNTSQIIRDVASNRIERVSFASDEKLLSPSGAKAKSEPIPVRLPPPQPSQRSSSPPDSQPKPQRLSPENVPPNATRAYVNLEKKEITVTKPGERSISCKLEVNLAKPTPEGSYCIRPQGKEQISISNVRTWASPVDNFGAIVSEITNGKFQKNSLRSEWHLLEPQFNTNSSRINLHPGTISAGCVTVTDNQCYSNIAGILNSSETFLGYGTNGKPTTNNSGNTVTCVGILTVNKSGKQGEVIRTNSVRFQGRGSDYNLNLNIGNSSKPENSRFGLGVSKNYENTSSGNTISTPSQNRNYNLGVRLPEPPSADPSQYSPELLRGSNQPKQSTPNKSENQKSGSSGSNGDGGADKRGGSGSNGDLGSDWVGPHPSDNIA